MVVHGDLNARVGNEVIKGIVGRHGVPGTNESGERLLEMCAEQELPVSNSWLKKQGVYKCTWLRMAEGRVVDRALMDYMLRKRIIIIKRGWQCKAGRDRLTPYQSEDPNPTTPTHRKKEEKGKTGDKK